LILAYHNVITEPGGRIGDRSLHLGFDLFRRHLDLLTRRLSIVSLDQVLLGKASAGSAALTFDDAYASAVTLALPELAQRGLPATVFIAPGLLGLGEPWWDVIATGPSGLDDENRAYCLTKLAGRTAPILEWARTGASTAGKDSLCRIANGAELALIRGSPLVTVGAHSWSHPNLCELEEESLTTELSRPAQWLAQNFPEQDRPWLAYPYGLYSKKVVMATKALGYVASFAISGGWMSTDGSADVLPRLNVPAGLSPKGLGARLNGFLI